MEPRTKQDAARAGRPWGWLLLFGLLSGALYALVFAHQGWITEQYTRGGWSAALPVLTALVFSLVHGTFAGSALSCLGIEPRRAAPSGGAASARSSAEEGRE